MHPVIFKIGPFILYSFSLLLAIGLVMGSFVVWRLGREEQSEEKLFDTILISFILTLLTSRFFYIFSHFDFFSFDVLKWILFLHYPGFSFWGGFMGAVLGLIISTRSRLLLLKYVDLFSLGFALAVIFGDLGCFLGGCVVGSPARLPWAIVVPGFEFSRHPLSFYLFLADFVVLVLIFKIYYYFKGQSGLTGLFYLSLFFIVRGLAEFYKDGRSFMGHGLIVLGFLGAVVFYKKIGRSFKDDCDRILRLLKEGVKRWTAKYLRRR